MHQVRKRGRLGDGDDDQPRLISSLEEGESAAIIGEMVPSSKQQQAGNSRSCYCRRRRNITWMPLLYQLVLVSALVYGLSYDGYYNMLESDELMDPFQNAKVFEPHRYFYIQWLEDPPSSVIKTFTLRQDNSYVIHLPEDTTRLEEFQKRHVHLNFSIPVFPATDWPQMAPAEQDKMIGAYPSIARSARKKEFGDAGCASSHIRLLTKIANETGNSSSLDYVFVFEDDAQIHEPLLSTRVVQAPSDADVIFLPAPSHYATRRVHVQTSNIAQSPANFVRIIEGYGTHGYIITRNGAAKFLRDLKHRSLPIDNAMLSSWKLHVYQPYNSSRILVSQHHGISSRTKRNQNKRSLRI